MHSHSPHTRINIVNAVRATALVSALGLAATVLAVSGPPDEPRETQNPRVGTSREQTMRREMSHTDADLKKSIQIMRQSGMTLEKAIATAERQCNGSAIEARCSHVGADGRPAIDVTVIDESGRAMIAVIELRDGSVRSTRAAGGEDLTITSKDRGVILKASDLKGRSLVDAQNRTIGEIEELVIDEARGRVAYAIVDVDAGPDRLVAVPWSALSHQVSACSIDLHGNSLSNAPLYDETKWSSMPTEAYGRTIAEFYHSPVYGSDLPVREGVPLTFIKLDDVIGMDINGTTNEKLGDIEDLALEPASGRIAYAALSFGGFLGFNDKLFAVPWDALTARKDGSVVLAIDKSKLNTAPGFDKSNWPTTANERFESEVRNFYPKRTSAAGE